MAGTWPWERLCDALARPDLKSHHLARGSGGQRARDELQAIFSTRGSDEWLRLLRDVDCCVELVLPLDEAIAGEQARAREMTMEMECPDIGRIPIFGPPLKIEDVSFDPCPQCGGAAQTEEILRTAGYGPSEIEAWRLAGVIG